MTSFQLREHLMREHRSALAQCKECPDMTGPVVSGSPVLSPLLLIGQAPGDKEGGFGKPFAWTAGKTLFKWFECIGLNETEFRRRVYLAAVCRCFPGKNPKGGDRVPNRQEIENCAKWLQAEMDLLKPELILPVGKLAIAQLMPVKRLNDVSTGEYFMVELQKAKHNFFKYRNEMKYSPVELTQLTLLMKSVIV